MCYNMFVVTSTTLMMFDPHKCFWKIWCLYIVCIMKPPMFLKASFGELRSIWIQFFYM